VAVAHPGFPSGFPSVWAIISQSGCGEVHKIVTGTGIAGCLPVSRLVILSFCQFVSLSVSRFVAECVTTDLMVPNYPYSLFIQNGGE